MLEAIFFILFFLILYVYFGYPLIIYLIGKLNWKTIKTDDQFRPHVTLIIAAYNEEHVIEEKIKNSFEIDYPKDKLEIIVFSDGSTDRTNEIVEKFEKDGVKLLRTKERKGKTAGQNFAVSRASGEIIVFSDANAFYQKDAIQKIVRNFSDKSIGCVCGELVYFKDNRTLIGDAEDAYWNYEKFIKRQENRAASILGANGSIYAVRKELYAPLPGDIISDFIEPLKIIEQGYRVIYEPSAFSFEQSTTNFRQEYRRKERIINRSFYSLLANKTFLNPLKYPLLSFQLWSHKILRWLIPMYLPVVFVTNVFLLDSLFFQIALVFQILFYLFAGFGYFLEKNNWHNIFFYVPFYYCLVNIASFKAIVLFVTQKTTVVTWEPIRNKN